MAIKQYKFEESKKPVKEAISKEKIELGLTRYLKQEGVSQAYVGDMVSYIMKLVQVGITEGKFNNATRAKIEKIFQGSL